MSYDIYIGEAVLDVPSPEDAAEGATIDVHVEHLTLPDAPVFDGDEMTGNGNARHPGYSQWANFCESAGLTKLFFGEGGVGQRREGTGLLRAHPGTAPLLPDHRSAVREALRKWQEQHPGARPGFVGEQDPILARLIWLDFWIGWALSSCRIPAIHNH